MDYLEELLQSYNMSDVNLSTIPLCSKLHNLKPSPGQLAEVPENELTHYHQKLVGQLLYPAVCTWPDITFTAAALGQYNAKPTHEVANATKGVLRYLAGTK